MVRLAAGADHGGGLRTWAGHNHDISVNTSVMDCSNYQKQLQFATFQPNFKVHANSMASKHSLGKNGEKVVGE